MKRISEYELATLCNGQVPHGPFHEWPLHSQKYWKEATERINKHFVVDPPIDEQSNECPIPTLQEDA